MQDSENTIPGPIDQIYKFKRQCHQQLKIWLLGRDGTVKISDNLGEV